jgi:hypothetical protein
VSVPHHVAHRGGQRAGDEQEGDPGAHPQWIGLAPQPLERSREPGRQILCDDPAGNPVELFEAR